MSDTIDNPQRRRLLARCTAALLTGAAIATGAHAAPVASPGATGDDAELLGLCTEFHGLSAVMAAWPRDDDRGFCAKLVERWDVSDDIMSLSATTDRGRREKAAIALFMLEEQRRLGRRPHDGDCCGCTP